MKVLTCSSVGISNVYASPHPTPFMSLTLKLRKHLAFEMCSMPLYGNSIKILLISFQKQSIYFWHNQIKMTLPWAIHSLSIQLHY